jgi:hypothetical protein
VIVNDVEKPVLLCPVNIIGNNDAGQCSKFVSYNVPIGQDNCPATTVLVGGLGDDAAFPVGITTEQYTTTDPSGNTGSVSKLCVMFSKR